MWPWAHLVIGYILYSLIANARSWRTDGYVVFLVAFGTQFPDLIDKPFAWGVDILPSGRSLGHSLIFGILVMAVIALYYHRRDRPLLGIGFVIGYFSHLIGDIAPHILAGEYSYLSFLLWPFLPVRSYPIESFTGHILNIEPEPYFVFQAMLVVLTIGLWMWDETPGISKGTAKLHGETPRMIDSPPATDDEHLDSNAIASPSQTDHDLIVSGESEQAPRLSIVIPTLNEEKSISKCIGKIKSSIDDIGIPTEIIIADNSTDQTPEIARNQGATVVTPEAIGYGYACRYAFEYVRGEYVAIGDGNATYDFEELPKLIEPLMESDVDIVIGNRFDGAVQPGAMSPFNYLENVLLVIGLRVFYGSNATDPRSGFRAVRREALGKLDLRADGLEITSEMLIEAVGRKLTVLEIPVIYHKRTTKTRLDSFQEGWRHIRFMLLNAPGYVFLIPGVLLSATGIALVPPALLNIDFQGVSFGLHFLIADSMLIIVGQQFLVLGVFARITGNPIRMPDDPVTDWISRFVRLRHVATVGTILLTAGGAYVLYVLSRWAIGEPGNLPILVGDIVAFTSIILGVQTILYSIFISVVKER